MCLVTYEYVVSSEVGHDPDLIDSWERGNWAENITRSLSFPRNTRVTMNSSGSSQSLTAQYSF